MKIDNKIAVAVILVVVLLLLIIFYAMQNQKVETSMVLHENEINSGDISGDVLKEESGESGEWLISGDVLESGEIIACGEETQSKEEQPKDTSKKNTEMKEKTTSQQPEKLTSDMPYYIKVNNAQNVVTIYTKDADGNYTVPYKAMICSVGSATPAAGKSHKITSYKKRWNYLQGNVYGQYATQIVGNILFHSVPYTAKDNGTLEYWEYDKLGTDASLGCIRLMVKDAKWIYDNIGRGTVVEFYEDSNPGPLGKPYAMKISDNEACRNWDPTDTAEGNPWNAPAVVTEVANDRIIENIMESGNQEEINVIQTPSVISGENTKKFTSEV